MARTRVTIEPKIIYLADRKVGLSDEAFAERWSEHGTLAMSLPIWRNMKRYAQCDPVALGGLPGICDGIGLVWYRSLEAMASIAAEPTLRQPLLDDELRTFSCHVREVAMLTEEEVLVPGPRGGWKLFVFDPGPQPPVDLARGEGVRAATLSRLLSSDYTSSSRLPYRSVLEVWFADRLELEALANALLPTLREGGRLAAGAFERPLFGYEGLARSGRLEHRHSQPVFLGFERDDDIIADGKRVEVALDNVGEHRRAFVQRDISDGERRRGAAHDGPGIDLPLAGGLDPLGVERPAMRALGARIDMGLAAGAARLDHQLSCARAFPVGLGLSIDRGMVHGFAHGHSLSRMTVDAA